MELLTKGGRPLKSLRDLGGIRTSHGNDRVLEPIAIAIGSAWPILVSNCPQIVEMESGLTLTTTPKPVPTGNGVGNRSFSEYTLLSVWG